MSTMINTLKIKIASLVLLAGCSGNWETNYAAPLDEAVARSWNVTEVSVSVPSDLTTTERNSYAPNADIVWHGEPAGDRRAQAAAILQTGISHGAETLRGNQPVTLNVVLQEFHALTPAARDRAPSAVHNITYTIQVNDARTGEPLTQQQLIRADLEAFVGEAAYQALARGESQKVRITRHLSAVTASWLGTGPDVRRTFSSTGR